MLFANQIAMILNIDVRDTLHKVPAVSSNAGRLACCAHYVGSQRSQGTLWGVFGGRYHSQEGS